MSKSRKEALGKAYTSSLEEATLEELGKHIELLLLSGDPKFTLLAKVLLGDMTVEEMERLLPPLDAPLL